MTVKLMDAVYETMTLAADKGFMLGYLLRDEGKRKGIRSLGDEDSGKKGKEERGEKWKGPPL
jgi:hypothetical protein